MTTWDHWIAFALLAGLGVRMVHAGLRAPGPGEAPKASRHGFWLLAVTGFATSFDAMAALGTTQPHAADPNIDAIDAYRTTGTGVNGQHTALLR